MRRDRLTDNQRYTLLVFDALWRAHKSAFSAAQIKARGYEINNLTLSSLRNLNLIIYSEQGWMITRTGRHVAELLQEILMIYPSGHAQKAVQESV